MGSSLSKSHLPRNYWPEETGQVNGPPTRSGLPAPTIRKRKTTAPVLYAVDPGKGK
jgi:hypothetical protein